MRNTMIFGNVQKMHTLYRYTLVALIALALTSTALLTRSFGQAKKPYDKDKLIQVLKLNALSTDEIVSYVRERGVDFQLSPEIEQEFRNAGARPELIEAIRSSYRPPASSSSGTSATPSDTSTPGDPLSKSEIITLLKSGVSSQKVEQYVDKRGVTFTLTPEISKEITNAGGSRSLIGTISVKFVSVSSSPNNITRGTTRTVKPVGPDYEELTDQAVAAIQGNNSAYAMRLLQQAISLDSSKPVAYQLMGFTQLYVNGDILSAERSMRAAIERGGNAVFRAFHDHNGYFTQYCQGSFFITKTGVTFKADDGNHTFQAADTDIKESKLNTLVGVNIGAFHLKVVQPGGKTKNFNFAPATNKQAESNLIINLIKSY